MQGYMPGLPNAMHSLAFLKVIDDLCGQYAKDI